jgi:hypothetical protein
MATETNGMHLYLHQLAHIVDIMVALCLHCFQSESLAQLETDMDSRLGGLAPAVRQIFDLLLKRTTIEEVDAEEEKRCGQSLIFIFSQLILSFIRYDWGAHAAHAAGGTFSTSSSTAKKAPVSKKRKAGTDLSTLGDEELNKM